MVHAAERWRATRISDFERGQMTGIRQELDQEYETQIAQPARSSEQRAAAVFPAVPRI